MKLKSEYLKILEQKKKVQQKIQNNLKKWLVKK